MGKQAGLGNYIGTVGQFVGYKQGGKYYVRTKPQGTSAEPSETQTAQRARFAEVSAVASAANEWAKRYFKGKLKQVSAYNYFLSYNKEYLTAAEASPEKINFPQSFLGDGLEATGATAAGRKVSFTLPEFPAGENDEPIKEVIAVAYVVDKSAGVNKAAVKSIRAISKVYTDAGEKTLTVPIDVKAGDTIILYLQGGNGADKLTYSTAQSLTVA